MIKKKSKANNYKKGGNPIAFGLAQVGITGITLLSPSKFSKKKNKTNDNNDDNNDKKLNIELRKKIDLLVKNNLKNKKNNKDDSTNKKSRKNKRYLNENNKNLNNLMNQLFPDRNIKYIQSNNTNSNKNNKSKNNNNKKIEEKYNLKILFKPNNKDNILIDSFTTSDLKKSIKKLKTTIDSINLNKNDFKIIFKGDSETKNIDKIDNFNKSSDTIEYYRRLSKKYTGDLGLFNYRNTPKEFENIVLGSFGNFNVILIYLKAAIKIREKIDKTIYLKNLRNNKYNIDESNEDIFSKFILYLPLDSSNKPWAFSEDLLINKMRDENYEKNGKLVISYNDKENEKKEIILFNLND